MAIRVPQRGRGRVIAITQANAVPPQSKNGYYYFYLAHSGNRRGRRKEEQRCN